MSEGAGTARRATAWQGYLQRCALRDESALAALYDESSSLVFTIAMRVLQDEADASEVVVDVYRQVWEAAIRFDERRGSAEAWLVVLARSRAIDRRRSRCARTRAETQAGELAEFVSPLASPEDLAISDQTSRTVLRALAEVPSEQRLALEMAFLSGLSHSEISERLGEPLGTVKTRIRLGVIKLRELLKDAI